MAVLPADCSGAAPGLASPLIAGIIATTGCCAGPGPFVAPTSPWATIPEAYNVALRKKKKEEGFSALTLQD